jgi:hypothetical protein
MESCNITRISIPRGPADCCREFLQAYVSYINAQEWDDHDNVIICEDCSRRWGICARHGQTTHAYDFDGPPYAVN